MLLFVLCNPARSETAGINYTVKIEGALSDEIRDLMKSVSRTEDLKNRPPAALNLLRRRAEDDVPLLLQVLRSKGYYGAKIEVEIAERAKPVSVIFRTNPGPVYIVESVEIENLRAPDLYVELPSPSEIGLELGKPAIASEIIAAEADLLRRMRRKGFPFASIQRQVIVNHDLRKVLVKYQVDPGPLARFGQTAITGLQTVSEEFALTKIPWQRGDLFDVSLLTQLRDRLIRTGLFSLVQVKEGESVEDGFLPVRVEVQERKHRTAAAGLSYYTDEGLGATLSWENRNLFGEAERLRIAGTVSKITLSAELIYEQPEFLQDNQSLLFFSRLAEDDTDAYTSRNVETALVLERRINDVTRIGAGPALRWSRVEDAEGIRDFVLMSFPGYLNRDTSDSLLNPTRGGRLSLQLTPYTDLRATDITFLKGVGSYNHYFRISESPFTVFAVRGSLGSITGTDRDSIPADIRFYAGGGGSIRGYAYQTVDPLLNGEPIGGRSLVEASLEFRLKVTDTIGFVTFLDGGNVYETAYPQFDESLRWGAGVGFRYYTKVGPLRLDVAVPLNPRDDIDDPYQLYISLGQAF